MKKIPNHVAFVMDGNRRWAASQGVPKMLGHTKGADNIKPILARCLDLGVSYATFWALSTENIRKREKKELDHIFSLFSKLMHMYLDDFMHNNIKMEFIGNVSQLPKDVQTVLVGMREKTKEHTAMTAIFAVNYGGRDEIVRAIKKIVDTKVQSKDIDEGLFSTYLDTNSFPDPDLIIRTGGCKRLSGYLPWQSTYSELYFTDTYWPGFTPEELDSAVEWYGKVKRNNGR